MQLTGPIIITPRLMAGVEIDGAFISIGYSKRPGDDGRTRYRYCIDLPGIGIECDDMQSGCQGGNLREGLESLLSFLGACAESIAYAARSDEPGENADLFPPVIARWAARNSDELSLLAREVEESPDCILE